MSKPTRVALYLRVSTGSQDVQNQRADLLRWAEYRGHNVVAEFADEGISGAKGRDKRPALNALMKAAARREFDVVACWSLCRLGRSMQHLVQLGAEFKELGIELFMHRDGIDTSTTTGELFYNILAALASFERERLRERSMAGQARARAQGKRIGRPRLPDGLQRRAEALLLQGRSQRAVRRELMLSGGAVANIRQRLIDAGALAP